MWRQKYIRRIKKCDFYGGKKKFSESWFFLVVESAHRRWGWISVRVMFPWLEERVPVLWLIELDLVSLKDSAVSSRRFWGVLVFGFSMSLGSPSGFGSVRHIYFHSCIKMALSAASPYLSLESLSVLFPGPALHCRPENLLGRGLLWIFFSAPWPCRLHHGDLCGLLSPSHPPPHPLSSPSMLWGLYVSLCWLPRPVFYVAGLVRTCVGSPACSLCPEACVSFLWLPAPTLFATGLLWASLSSPVSHFLLPQSVSFL